MEATIPSLFLGLGLAASVGFRMFLPLLFLSAAAYFDVVPVGENWQWIGSIPAMVALGFATILEILAYYIPWVDNALDAVELPVAAFAGTAVMASTAMDIDPLWKWALAIIAGGGTASVVKGSNSGVRLASTTSSGGVTNPVISTVETFSAAGLSFLSIYLWPIAAIITISLLVATVFFWRSVKKYFSRKKT